MEAEVRGADTDGQYIDSDLLIYAWKQRSLGNQKVVVPYMLQQKMLTH